MEVPKTGDLLLFGTNRGMGGLIRFGTSSEFNHVGIAMWLNPLTKKITLESGELYVFDMSRAPRYENYYNKISTGAGLTKYSELQHKYSVVVVRPLQFRPEHFLLLTREALHCYGISEFEEATEAFVAAWLQIPLVNKHRHFPRFICTELSMNYYKFVFQKEHLLGPEAPWVDSLLTPESFSPLRSPNSPIFQNRSFFLKIPDASWQETLYWPLILAVSLLLLCWFFCFFFTSWVPKRLQVRT